MALYLPPSGPVFDPPAIVEAAPAWALVGPLAALMADYAPPKSLVPIFDELSADHRPAVKLAIMQQLLLAVGPSGNTYINSVQQGTITISAGTSNTDTKTVVSANAFPVWQGFSATGSSADAATSSPRLTYSISGGTMTLTATLNSTGSCVVNYAVVDPKAALVSAVAHNTITISAGTSATATGLTLSTTATAVFYLGQTSTTSAKAYWDTASATRLAVTNTTTITATLNSTGTVTVSYVAVTFNAAALQSSVQQFAITKASGTSNTQAVTSVVAANSMLAYGGFTLTASGFAGVPWAVLTNGTTITLTNNSVPSTYTFAVTVIEFVPGVLKSNQNGSVAISASTSGTTTPGTAVTAANTLCAFCGMTGAGTTDATTNTRITLTNATPTITANVTTSSSPTAGYGLYEFN